MTRSWNKLTANAVRGATRIDVAVAAVMAVGAMKASAAPPVEVGALIA